MISLRTVSGKEFFLNADSILKIEKDFDTLITLVDHKTLRVMDTPEEISEKVLAYKRKVYQASRGV
ncbi:MAG: flagellar FlbD family protein [Alkalibacterium sp.]|nr:flagellar FlbD family protein [Alkalibacterium sp.]